jgi:hypothetical protein
VIVGLVGFIGAGKGSVADLLVERHGFIKESFANSVKDAVSVVFGWDRALLEGDTPESRAWREQKDDFWSKKFGKDFSPRLALQLMGTEAGRDVFHSDIWVHTVQRRCNDEKNYVIADVRFPNEIDAIAESGGRIIRVKRGEDPNWYDIAERVNLVQIDYNNEAKSIPAHYSEWAWIGSPIDYTISNDGTFDELIKKVDITINLIYNNGSTLNNEV